MVPLHALVIGVRITVEVKDPLAGCQVVSDFLNQEGIQRYLTEHGGVTSIEVCSTPLSATVGEVYTEEDLPPPGSVVEYVR